MTRPHDSLFTWRRIDWLRLPLRINEVFHPLIIGLRDQAEARFILVLQLLPLHKRRDDALDRIRPIAEVAPDGIGDFVQEHAGRVEDAQTADGGDVLRDDVFGLRPWVEETFDIAVPQISTTCEDVTHVTYDALSFSTS